MSVISNNSWFKEDGFSIDRVYGLSLDLFELLVLEVLHFASIVVFPFLLSLSMSFSISDLLLKVSIYGITHEITHIYFYKTIRSPIWKMTQILKLGELRIILICNPLVYLKYLGLNLSRVRIEI
jgi:hypothetical protein